MKDELRMLQIPACVVGILLCVWQVEKWNRDECRKVGRGALYCLAKMGD